MKKSLLTLVWVLSCLGIASSVLAMHSRSTLNPSPQKKVQGRSQRAEGDLLRIETNQALPATMEAEQTKDLSFSLINDSTEQSATDIQITADSVPTGYSETHTGCTGTVLPPGVGCELTRGTYTPPAGTVGKQVFKWTVSYKEGPAVTAETSTVVGAKPVLVAVGEKGYRRLSYDEGQTWVKKDVSDENEKFKAIDWNHSVDQPRFILVGINNTQTKAYYTSDPSSDQWNTAAISAQVEPNDLACNPGRSNECVMVGKGGFIARTTTGESWTQVTSGVNSDLKGITWNKSGSNYIVVGDANSSNGVILRSSNGTTWSAVTSSATANLNLEDVVCHEENCVISTNKKSVLKSTNNGVTWSLYQDANLPEGNRSSIAVSDTASGLTYTLVGGGCTVSTSSEGTQWATHAISGCTKIDLMRAIWDSASDRFVVGAEDSAVLLSQNNVGSSWQYINTGNALWDPKTVYGLCSAFTLPSVRK